MENRPASATNGRVRPEGLEFAQKNTQESNWFSHDVQDSPSPSSPVTRNGGSKTAKAIATKYKGESENWYTYTHNGVQNGIGTPRPKVSKTLLRCGTPEARHNLSKIKGTKENWFRHEDNKNYVSPRPQSRVTVWGQESKDKNSGSPSSWYKHDSKGEPQASKAKSRLGSASARSIASKMRPQGLPVWASYDQQNGTDQTDSRPQSRLTDPQAVEMQQKSKGSANEWFGHHANGHAEEILSPRRGSEEGQKNAQKLKDGSGVWYNHDANKNYVEPAKAPRCRSASAREMIGKSQGSEVSKALHFEENGVQLNGNHVNSHITPEAAEFAKKSVNGMMSKYFDSDSNQNYNSPRPHPRIHSAEAQANADRNKGVMNGCMEGYLDSPKKHEVRRIKPEAEGYANRNRGVLGKAMTGDLPESVRKAPRATGDAAKNAERNKGSGNLIGDFQGLEIRGSPVKYRSSEAESNAAKWKGGEMSGIFNMGY